MRNGLLSMTLAVMACQSDRQAGALLIVGPGDSPAAEHLPAGAFPVANDEHFTSLGDAAAISHRELLLMLSPGTTVDDANDLLEGAGATIIGAIPDAGLLLVDLSTETLDELMTAATALATDPRVLSVVPELAGGPALLPPTNVNFNTWDWNIPNLATVPRASPIPQGNWGLKYIRAPQVWNLDTFVRRTRPGLVAAGVVDAGFTDALAAEGPSRHADFKRKDGTVVLQLGPSKVDDHGTLVSGIIGAGFDNSVGVEGLNPWLSAIHARASVFDSRDLGSFGRQLDAILALLATRPDVKAVNNSYGISNFYELADKVDNGKVDGSFDPRTALFGDLNGDGDIADTLVDGATTIREWAYCDLDSDGAKDTFESVIRRHGAIVQQAVTAWSALHRKDFLLVAAAGNSGPHFDAELTSPLAAAAYSSAGTGAPFLSVGSIDARGVLSTFSAPGASVLAPGQCVRTTEADNGINADDPTCPGRDDGDVQRQATQTGTSLAAPFVTGLATVLWKLEPTLTAAEVIGLLTGPATTRAAGGGQRVVDAFAAALAIDGLRNKTTLQVALSDLDDGTLDGCQRTERDDKGAVTTPFTQTTTADGLRGDGRISMADFRALRDAVLVAGLEGWAGDGKPDLAAGATDLDGAPDHPKLDLNGDGCIRSAPVAGNTANCALAPYENVFPRADLNGDGRVDPTSLGVFKGVALTDLGVLAAVWPSDPERNEGHEAAALLPLLGVAPGAGDAEFRTNLVLAAASDLDQIRITIDHSGKPMMRDIVALRPRLVWTVAAGAPTAFKAEGFKADQKVRDLCISGTTDPAKNEIPKLKPGQDVVVLITDCKSAGGGPRVSMTGYLVARADYTTGSASDSVTYYDDYQSLEGGLTDNYECPVLQVGSACDWSKTLSRSGGHSTATANVSITRVAVAEWLVTASLDASSVQPPQLVPPGQTCTDPKTKDCEASASGTFSVSVHMALPLPEGTHDLLYECAGSGTAQHDPTSGPVVGSSTSFRASFGTEPSANCTQPDTYDLTKGGWTLNGTETKLNHTGTSTDVDLGLMANTNARWHIRNINPEQNADYAHSVKATLTSLRVLATPK